MGKQKHFLKEQMRLLYNDKHWPVLWGHVAFYKQQHPGQKMFTESYKSSKPFVIGKHVLGSDRFVVYGSVHFLVLGIRRLIDEFTAMNKEWWFSRQKVVNDSSLGEVDFLYDSHVMDFVVLISTYTRNLFHLVNNEDITGKTIPMLDYEKKQAGEVKLNELFDILIHNRYYYFDGSVIQDIFSEQFKSKSQLASKFMGYGIDLQAYVQGVSDAINEVRMKHLTTILRGRMKHLSLDSKPQDVIFLIQNVHSFSDLMKTKIPTGNYRLIENLMFGNYIEDIVYESPNIEINSYLNRKAFDIRVRWAKRSEYDGDKGKLKNKLVTVGYESLFTNVNALFGEERLLDFKMPDQATAKKVVQEPV